MAKTLPWVGLIMFLSACAPGITPRYHYSDEHPRWAAFYAENITPEELIHYDLLVFDGIHHPPLEPYKGRVKLLQYISIGEVHGHLPLRTELERQGAIIGYNKTWDSYVVNISNPLWRNHVLSQAQAALHAGFDGVMLDTADSVLYHKQAKNINAHAELVNLIKDIRKLSAKQKIMLNRGFNIIPEVSSKINYVLAESILIDSTQHYRLSTAYTQSSYESTARFLQQVKQLSPRLKVYTLDYWNPEDAQGILRIYKKQRARGFIPYVATRDLRHHLPEPSAALGGEP